MLLDSQSYKTPVHSSPPRFTSPDSAYQSTISSFFYPVFVVKYVEWVSLYFAAQLIEGLVMKPCHENNGAAICVGRAATTFQILLLFV